MPVKKDKKNKKEKEDSSKILYVRAASAEDVCRYACRFDFTSGTLLLQESKKEKLLVALGEHVEKTQIAYFAPVKESGSLIAYEPSYNGGKDRMAFINKAELMNKYCINVMRVGLGAYGTAKTIDSKKVHFIAVEKPLDLIGAAIRKASKEETIANAYSFSWKGKNVLAAFDVIDSLADGPVLYYSFADSKIQGNFARYDYRNNVLDFTDFAGDHAYMYAKVINLAEPFPFFNPENK
jgi:hypothetical protein